MSFDAPDAMDVPTNLLFQRDPEDLNGIGSEFAFRIDVPVKGLSCNAELSAELKDLRLRLSHRGLRQPELGRRHLRLAAAVSAPGTGRRKPGFGPLDDELTLEFRQCREDAEHETAIGGGGVDVGTLPRQDLETDTTLGEVMNGVDEVAQVATDAVDLPGRKRITFAQRLETRFQPRTAVAFTGRVILVDAVRLDPGRKKRIALQVGGL